MFRPLSSERFNAPGAAFSPGPAPFLGWVEIEKLVVDTEYQRDIGRRGTANVHHIAENFDWSKFAPVIVAPVEGGFFERWPQSRRFRPTLVSAERTRGHRAPYFW